MSVGVSTVAGSSGPGTLKTSTSSTNIAAAPPAATLAGNLVLLFAYVVGQDPTLAVDAGDGWVILAGGYDSVNTFGIIAAACNAPFGGAAGYAGLTLPGLGAYTAQTVSFYPQASAVSNSQGSIAFFDFDKAKDMSLYLSATASSATLTVPDSVYGVEGQQHLEFWACGYNNAGTTTTSTPNGALSEAFDTGQASPTHGITGGGVNSVNTLLLGPTAASGRTCTLLVAKTNRNGVLVRIPLVSSQSAQYRGRYMAYRRVG